MSDKRDESYGGSGREVQGGGPAGRGVDEDAPTSLEQERGEGGTSGASSAIGDGEKRRAGSGASGSVPLPPD